MNRVHNHLKIRRRLSGTKNRPRLAVYRSVNNMFAQLIDDEAGKTLVSASSIKLSGSLGSKAEAVGKEIAEKAVAAKITSVVFDRGGFIFQGNVKKLADAARQGGLKF